ncbi:hypothetical protein ABT160_05665 [Streptomyces sp. NPDC001941]|uniref:hypothetical protein n=1 Tax=Streptomyces sp. NPDC001941 TaxID=3154659 RepID=UPI00331FB344
MEAEPQRDDVQAGDVQAGDVQGGDVQRNAVRLGPDGSLEYYDGSRWQPYPDVPDDDDFAPRGLMRPADGRDDAP